MSPPHRIIWSQGLFLQPHHFQQETRHLEHLLDARIQAAHPYAWGFESLVLDEAQLALGRLALTRARGVLPDGTVFSIPDVDAPPPPLELGADVQGEVIALALPLAQVGVTQVALDAGVATGALRYSVVETALRDETQAADEPEPVQLAAPQLRLARPATLAAAHAALGVARIVERRADGQVVLDRHYIAPQVRLDASAQLSVSTALLHGLVQQRAQALAAQMGQPGHGVSEVMDMLTLQLLNRSEPVLAQLAGVPAVHPWYLHQVLLALAGELTTYLGTSRVPPAYPLYRHDDLQAVFSPLVQGLRDLLSTVTQRHAEAIELTDRSHGVRTAVIADAELLRSAGLVLAVRAQLPTEQLRQRFVAHAKLGPSERLRDLVNLQLPGLPLHNLAVAPRQLPYHAGSLYFEIERQGELWQQLQRSGALALHVAGDFPGLELELWAIRP
ncbi:MAG: type VI secretion system baseplate subunit TssK [Proteobacteria bacterium]|nr:type VI secretion system baseplate subunit TssK [Pseudomonadota bacterium]